MEEGRGAEGVAGDEEMVLSTENMRTEALGEADHTGRRAGMTGMCKEYHQAGPCVKQPNV